MNDLAETPSLHPVHWPRRIWSILREATAEIFDDDCPSLAASLAFYALFSFAPLIVVVVRLLSTILAPDHVEDLVVATLGELVGPAGEAQSREVLASFQAASSGGGWLAAMVSFGLSLFGATTVVVQLQTALNRAWNVKRKRKLVPTLVTDRLVSLAIVAVLAVVLLASTFATSLLSVLRVMTRSFLPELLALPALRLGDVVASWTAFAAVFALLFKWVPNTRTRWSNVAIGAATTSALFVVGQQAIAWYLAQGATGSLYGAAGSLAAVLTWVFYSALILLFGAELTHTVAEHRAA